MSHRRKRVTKVLLVRWHLSWRGEYCADRHGAFAQRTGGGTT